MASSWWYRPQCNCGTYDARLTGAKVRCENCGTEYAHVPMCGLVPTCKCSGHDVRTHNGKTVCDNCGAAYTQPEAK